jgi:hypothetical protein
MKVAIALHESLHVVFGREACTYGSPESHVIHLGEPRAFASLANLAYGTAR